MVPAPSVPRPFHRFHRALRSSLSSTLRPLQQHHYTLYDLQYLFLLLLFSFCFWIMEKPLWFKLPIAATAVLLLIPRRSRQFLLPFSAIAAWLILFYCCRFIPSEWRPHIFTSVLPALENIIYGGSISEMLASDTTPLKDILAWIPYGVLHYVLPIVVAILIVNFGPSGSLPVYARTFGYMNVAGVLTQIFFPCAPPWYETRYGGMQPATYTMPGDPGGLARVDDILGVEMYKTTFTASPLVFGAFPSLHSADASLLAFFLVYVFGPRSIPFAMVYVLWIWWATMYLGHHYVVDLVGGGAYAVIAFWIGSFFLPPVLPSQDEEQDEWEQYDQDEQAYGSKPKSAVYDLGEALDRHEKQILFSAPGNEDDEEAGSSTSIKAYGYDQELSDSESTHGAVDMSAAVVVHIPMLSTLGIEEARMIRSEPSSPTSSHPSSSSSSSSMPSSPSSWTPKQKKLPANYRQSWSGWQGYESWIEVLATVNSPRSSPRSSPKSSPSPSPRSSTANLPGAPF